MLTALTMAMAMTNFDPVTLKKRGFEVLEQIRREYYLPESKLYCDSIAIVTDASKIKQSGPAFNWGVGVMLSALNAAARLEPMYKGWLREYADASRIYWNDKGPVPGYDVLPGPKAVDRYYDDNAWMVLALMETYEILGDKKYLDWASEALDYVLSGEDSRLGGGIYWKEAEKTSKNTCSNAPSAAACLAVAKYRRSEELRNKAKVLLDWTRKHLQDPKDGLLWDNVNLSGRIDRTKYTYNTGLYLRAAIELDALTLTLSRGERGRQEPTPHLKWVAKNSVKHWIDPETGAAKDGGRFVHLWFEGLAEVGSSQPVMVKALDYVYTKVRNADGRYGDAWSRPTEAGRKKFELIEQASVARGFLFAAGLREKR
ncbi:MAG TPA: glycoside hydrolase family 76 protein [Fimbriimonadaceae bacterium]|nr:glycoside hydrolase family 76 protein [Fimbriimonadaceae bacterium]